MGPHYPYQQFEVYQSQKWVLTISVDYVPIPIDISVNCTSCSEGNKLKNKSYFRGNIRYISIICKIEKKRPHSSSLLKFLFRNWCNMLIQFYNHMVFLKYESSPVFLHKGIGKTLGHNIGNHMVFLQYWSSYVSVNRLFYQSNVFPYFPSIFTLFSEFFEVNNTFSN